MARFRFTQVDVFTDQPLKGNPLAVVHGADALSDAQMQAFANWTNLSETVFLLSSTDPAADYRVRIFTPASELPFAGHPTLGSCHAWLAAGGQPKRAGEVTQQCGVGLVRLRLEGERIAFAAPPSRRQPLDPGLLAQVVAALGVPATAVQGARVLDNGARWLGLLLDSAERVLSIEPDHAALRHLDAVGVIGPQAVGAFAGEGADTQFEVRAFADLIGVTEDPVTGSLNASLAQWLIGEGLAPARYVAAQGQRLGRAGRVHVAQDGGTVWVGGHSVSCVRGDVAF